MQVFLSSRIAPVGLLAISAVLFSAVSVYAGSTNQADFSIRNLTCGACVEKIQQALETVPGVSQVTVQVDTRSVQVAFDTAQTDAGELAIFLSGAGYPARLLEVVSAEGVSLGGIRRAPLPASATGSGGCGGSCCKGKS